MFLRADIDSVPGQAATLEKCMSEFLVPLATRAGWRLVASLREIENQHKIMNVWDVGDAFEEGVELMRQDAGYPKYKQLLSECIANETHTLCETWRQ